VLADSIQSRVNALLEVGESDGCGLGHVHRL
jgi:hypothetical protein